MTQFDKKAILQDKRKVVPTDVNLPDRFRY